MKCTDCKGLGKIQLLVSVVDCIACQGTGETPDAGKQHFLDALKKSYDDMAGTDRYRWRKYKADDTYIMGIDYSDGSAKSRRDQRLLDPTPTREEIQARLNDRLAYQKILLELREAILRTFGREGLRDCDRALSYFEVGTQFASLRDDPSIWDFQDKIHPGILGG